MAHITLYNLNSKYITFVLLHCYISLYNMIAWKWMLTLKIFSLRFHSVGLNFNFSTIFLKIFEMKKCYERIFYTYLSEVKLLIQVVFCLNICPCPCHLPDWLHTHFSTLWFIFIQSIIRLIILDVYIVLCNETITTHSLKRCIFFLSGFTNFLIT